MSSTPQFNGEQLAAARTERWHQGGDALLTLEASSAWVNEVGVVLFAPRAQQLPAPAASLVEATLGRAVSAPTAAEAETARSLMGRMVAEGAALPLNLLGSAGDVPDFVVSAQVFSYVFTLRGDKAWKQAPATSGSLKVSLLAAKVYETLAQRNAMTAPELASELGREVTEAAIVRALGELWAQLRVIPLLQQSGAGTMWELTSRRFTKQMKTGANAGQPTALSALISLYLAQSYAATEEEVETFLSPLAARSKVRDVLHGLGAARQLDNVVLEGKTLFYVPGALPEFAEIAAAEPEKQEAVPQVAEGASEPRSGERIRRFDRPRAPREDKSGARPFRKDRERPSRAGGERGFRTDRERPSKPFGEKKLGGARPTGRSFGDRERPAKPFGDKRRSTRPDGKSFGDREQRPKPFGEKRDSARGEGRSFGDRERRPFQRDRATGERANFSKPWQEERRPPRDRQEQGERPERATPRREGETRPPREKREFRAGPRSAGPRSAGPRSAGPRSAGPRSAGPRKGGAERGERPQRPFLARPDGERPFRPRPEGERPFRPKREGERPFRPKREGERPFRARAEGERPFRPRREGGDEASGSRPRKPFAPRKEGGREDRGKRGPGAKSGEKPGFGGKPNFGEKRKFGDKKFGDKKKFAGKPKFGGKPGAKGGPRKDKPKPKREAEE